ncbi:Glyoxalase-like domain protein [Streptomyces sp. YIM 130001]|uniref:VOC family protein n=1 Tax=Streptomyces sp. YIM 130001 TaxID=2259644 RepID=UPI000E65717E|nr:VOC family protein [Streptomyces sp. YIM 130001]RII15114.1 Glyoxalase-like domain protein [Streptomyces sp. YIM 130001]
MAVTKLGAVVLDCPDPRALAEFYAGLLGGTVTRQHDAGDEWHVLVGADGASTLEFQQAPDHVPPKWPSSDGSQQFHLDLTVTVDLDTAERHALELGATLLDRGDPSRTWRVYADPAGHPFCLCAC